MTQLGNTTNTRTASALRNEGDSEDAARTPAEGAEAPASGVHPIEPTPPSSVPPPPSRRPSSGVPSSIPPSRARQSSQPPPHEDLSGASGIAVAFRPMRLTAAEVPADLACQFRCDGHPVGPLTVIDLSSLGFAAAIAPDVALAPGCVLEGFELTLGQRVIWSGDAVVVHGGAERIGGRFTSGVVDIDRLRLGATLEGRLALHREQRERLPHAWRAAVGDLCRLLEDVRAEIEAFERAESHDPLQLRDEEMQLFATLRDRWGGAYCDALTELHEMSKRLDPRASALGRSYASGLLMPILRACPMHKRAHDKPLGYAGDFRMMELCFAPDPAGDTLFGRFLFSMMQSYTLARAVVWREVVVRSALQRAAAAPGEGPLRVLAVAAGPAMELRRWLQSVDDLRRPVELILLDQDRTAHETAHRQLTRILLERHRGLLPVTVKCLHFSVRQLVAPRSAEERAVVNETLANLDLVYSTGLYDYLRDLVAKRLAQRLYAMLRPQGRMLLGNLAETSDSTWLMDYVVDWPLLYRNEEDMVGLGEGLTPVPARMGVTRDKTNHCLFLDVTKPGEVGSAESAGARCTPV